METCSPDVAFWRPGATVQVQSVIYDNKLGSLQRAADSIARAAQIGVRVNACSSVSLRYGDCSSSAVINSEALEALRTAHANSINIDYRHFGKNLGSALGHNQLSKDTAADFILVQNPDVLISPRALDLLMGSFRRPGVGMVEAKQVPVEHPKDYDPLTGETSWATTACAMIPVPLFRQLSGFDSESFFLYCDDVDFSWRVRQAGFRVIFQPAAIIFHDKQLSADAGWKPSVAEKYYSAEASLFMAHKWSRPDLVEKYIRTFLDSGNQEWIKAATAFLERRKEGRLPVPIDSDHRIGTFIGIDYAPHRYPL